MKFITQSALRTKNRKIRSFLVQNTTWKSCLKLVEFVELVKPLSVDRVIPSCGGSKVNNNWKISRRYRTRKNNKGKNNIAITKNKSRQTKQRNTTQQHNTQLITTKHNATRTANRNTTQRNTTWQNSRQIWSTRSSWSIDQKLHGKIWSKNAARLAINTAQGHMHRHCTFNFIKTFHDHCMCNIANTTFSTPAPNL